MAVSKTTDQPEQTITLHQCGDRELWYAEGQDKSWQLPMLVEWRHDRENDKHYALVVPAVSLYINQSLTLQALFTAHDIMGSKERWLIPRGICEAILYKASGITPAYYYRWPEDNCPPLPPAFNMIKYGDKYKESDKDPEVVNGSPFIKHVASKSNLPSSIVNLVFKAICQEAPQWMLDNKRPLELGFCTLVALPFRVNWKEIVAFKCRSWKLRGIFNNAKDDNDLLNTLAERKMPAVMCSPQNIAMIRGKLDYTLEAIPTKRFQAVVQAVESRRMACGWNAYVAHYEETVEKLYHIMVRALGSYIKKAAAPFARVSSGSVSGITRLLSVGGTKARIHGVAVRNLPVHIIKPDSNFSVLEEQQQSDPRLIPLQVKGVLQVPAVLPANENLRQCDGNGEVEQQGHTGAARVPLLLTDQKFNDNL